ncbi:Type IV secretion system DNA-binding domain-containing protein [Sulfidibacter corallicola]
MAFDVALCGLVTLQAESVWQKRRLRRNPRAQWGNVFREEEFRRCEKNVKAFLAQEARANCTACGGTGKVASPETESQTMCPPCQGTGFPNGRVRPPFRVRYRDRNSICIAFDALTKEPVFLENEATYRATHVYGIQGTGKTKRIGRLVLNQLFADSLSSILYFSLKTEDAREMARLARASGWRVHVMKGVCLLNTFSHWGQFEAGIRKGMTAAGYQARESFWFDRTMQLLGEAYRHSLATQKVARLGPTIQKVLTTLRAEAAAGSNVKADQIAVSDVASYLLEFDDPLSPVRWVYDAQLDDFVPGCAPGEVQASQFADWSLMAQPRTMVIVPPTGTSRAGLVAATALKYAYLLWFEDNKDTWQVSNPDTRHRKVVFQDEGDNFLIISPRKDFDDIYATKTWREFGHSSWVFTQSKEAVRSAAGNDRAQTYLSVVGSQITFAIPDEEVAKWIKELPEYEYQTRTVNLNRSAEGYEDGADMLRGNLQVSRGESLQTARGPWITGEWFQRLPKGCAVFQQAGQTPRVLWIPFHGHVAIEGAPENEEEV